MSKLAMSDTNKHYNWLMGADMYFATTVLLCQELKKHISGINDIQQIGKKCGFTSSNPEEELLMPIVFNMKHALELYLKALIMIFENGHQHPEGHNIISILDHLICILKTNNSDVEIIKLLDTDLRNKIKKYYFGTYAFTTKEDKPDINNEAERYPEYKNKNCYEITNLLNIVNQNLIDNIEADCVYLRNTLRDKVYLVLSVHSTN